MKATRRPDVVVVGGGVLGTSTAWALAEAGANTLLFERDAIGSGDTAVSAGIVRTHYSNPVLVRMAVFSRTVLEELPARTGAHPVYDRLGWLFLVDETALARTREVAAMAREEGSDGRLVGASEIIALLPGALLEGVAAAVHEPGSGRADPAATASIFAEAARTVGAQVRVSSPVHQLVSKGDRVIGVETGDGVIHCGAVVVAAGVGSVGLAQSVSLGIPIVVTVEQEILLDAPERAMPQVVVSSLIDRFYLAPHHGRATGPGRGMVLAGSGYPKPMVVVNAPDERRALDPVLEVDLVGRIAQRLPGLEAAVRVEGTVGYYDVTPDWHPLLGPVVSRPGLHLACGGSGHSFKLAPAIGELVAAGILGTTPAWARPNDLATLSLDRFERGMPLSSVYAGNRA